MLKFYHPDKVIPLLLSKADSSKDSLITDDKGGKTDLLMEVLCGKLSHSKDRFWHSGKFDAMTNKLSHDMTIALPWAAMYSFFPV